MSDFFCPAQTYARTMVSPAEHCETEVEQEGDLCPAHDDDRADAAYDDYRESLWKE